jgi:hypothetical protein
MHCQQYSGLPFPSVSSPVSRPCGGQGQCSSVIDLERYRFSACDLSSRRQWHPNDPELLTIEALPPFHCLGTFSHGDADIVTYFPAAETFLSSSKILTLNKFAENLLVHEVQLSNGPLERCVPSLLLAKFSTSMLLIC